MSVDKPPRELFEVPLFEVEFPHLINPFKGPLGRLQFYCAMHFVDRDAAIEVFKVIAEQVGGTLEDIQRKPNEESMTVGARSSHRPLILDTAGRNILDTTGA